MKCLDDFYGFYDFNKYVWVIEYLTNSLFIS